MKAIKTTNLQESYVGKTKNGPRDENKKKLANELKIWGNATIIRCLVCPANDYNQDDDVAKYLSEENKSSDHELFLLCDNKHTIDLFGEMFARLAGAKTQGKDLKEVVEIRSSPSKKRSHNGNLPSGKRRMVERQ